MKEVCLYGDDDLVCQFESFVLRRLNASGKLKIIYEQWTLLVTEQVATEISPYVG